MSENDVQNLYLTVLNDPRLSPFGSGRGREISLLLIRKKWAQSYEPSKAVKAFQALTDQAAKDNTRQFNERGSYGQFGRYSPTDRKRAADELRTDFERRIKTGELDLIFPQSLVARRSLAPGVTAVAELKAHGIAGSILSASGQRLPASIPASAKTVKAALDAIEKQWKKAGGGKKNPAVVHDMQGFTSKTSPQTKPIKTSSQKRAKTPSKTAQRKANEVRRRVTLRRLSEATSPDERRELADRAEKQFATNAEIHRALAKSQRASQAKAKKRIVTLKRDLRTLIADQHMHRDDYRVRGIVDELKRHGVTDTAELVAHAERARDKPKKSAPRAKPKGPQPESGYAYRGTAKVTGANWRKVRDDEWQIMMISPERAGKIEHLGSRSIDGQRVNVWRIHDPQAGDFAYYAQQKRGR